MSQSSQKNVIFFVIRAIAGQEAKVAWLLYKRAESRGIRVKSILALPSLRGYLFVEADREYDVRRLVRGLQKAKMMRTNPVTIEEIDSMISKEPAKIEVKPGDVVKIKKGNFKGFRARVISAPEPGVESKEKRFIIATLLDVGKDWEIRIPLENVKILREED